MVRVSVLRSNRSPSKAFPDSFFGALSRTFGYLAGAGAVPVLCSVLIGCVEVPVTDNNPPPPDGRSNLDLGQNDGSPTTGPAWRWESPTPQGNNLRAVWGVPGRTTDEDQLYIGGDSGTLMAGGVTGWKLEQAFQFDRRVILGMAGQIVQGVPLILAVGVYDLALLRQSGTWSDLNPVLGTGDGALNSVWASATPGEFYVAGTTGRLFRVTNRGLNWARIGSGVTTDSLFGIAGSGSGATADVYAVGANGRIVHSTGGSSWAVEADNMITQQLNAVWLNTATAEVFAAGDSGVVLRKKNNSWTAERPPTSSHLTSLWGSATELWAAGARGAIMHRDSAGMWKAEAVGMTGELLSALWGTERDGQATVYAVGNLGTILRRDKGTWQQVSQRVTSLALNSVWARNPDEVYAVGSEGMIFRRSGVGAQGRWQQVTGVATSSSFNAVAGYATSATSQADVYAVGTDGTIVHKSGGTWAIEGATLTSGELTAVWVGSDSVYVVGRGGRVFRKGSTGWGPVPDPMGSPFVEDFYSVWGSGGSSTEVVYMGGNKGLIMRRQNNLWRQEAPGLTTEGIVALVGTSEDGLLAFGDKGTVLRRSAASSTWQPAPARPLTGGASGLAGCAVPGTGELWAIGKNPSLIMRRTGTEWQAEPPITPQPFFGISAAAKDDLFVVGANGLILHRY
jgi:hypothetical protein